MPLTPLTIQAFPGLPERIQCAIEEIQDDVRERPTLTKPRTVTKVALKKPGWESHEFHGSYQEVNGRLRLHVRGDPFEPNPNQTSIMDLVPQEEPSPNNP